MCELALGVIQVVNLNILPALSRKGKNSLLEFEFFFPSADGYSGNQGKEHLP